MDCSTVIKSTVIRASDYDHSYSEKSELSLLDSLQPSAQMNMAFVYDYTIDVACLEIALEELLNRYPEMSGRVDFSKKLVNLNNEGALLLNLQESDICLDDLISRNFNFEYCLENLKPKYQIPDEYPLGLMVQNLAGNSGMMLILTVNHILVDVNAFYVIMTDFCSLVRNGQCKFEKVQQGNRNQYTKTSENSPRISHPEIRVFDSEEDINSFVESALAEILADPPITINFSIDNEMLRQLKKDVYDSASSDEIKAAEAENILPSTNDCLMALIYKVCLESVNHGRKASEAESKNFHPPVGLYINIRVRRNPNIPFTYIANSALGTFTKMPKNIDISNPFIIACSIRKDIAKINEGYCQPYEAYVKEFKFCRFVSMFHPTAIMFTNWNKLYDWYETANIGNGKPLKFFQLDRVLDRACLINDSPNGEGFDVYVSRTKSQMTSFMEHEIIKKYFKAI